MPFSRNHPRTTDTQDVSIRLRSAAGRPSTRRVLNLSEGGMLIAGGRLEVGSTMSFELAAGDLHAAGVARVEHCTSDTTGLRFVEWEPSADRRIQELIIGRIRNERHEEASRAVPGVFLG